ncbi:hypothetical protein RM863_25070 [Streptomyces sp. DSM 41014]|uniref:Lipoprotein n=1 Tax=Streptomyces hintoniae TaxID=3075521 RepID=A0ABU2UQ49_9ACTN|nr:hypothetical protein [Streptomyces sp. DSM 41014]MDT0475403.1 hypothetical protein [Streptomyces sp. DSM 41014]
MKRRTLPTVAALPVAAGLLLTACGGGNDEPEANDKIAGADMGGSTPPSPSTSAPELSKRPVLELPSDVSDVFESWKTGVATKDAVLADVQGAQTATDYAITRGSADEPSLAFYYRDKALVTTAQWVQSFVGKGLTLSGEIRYFDPQVTLSGDTSASVRYCSDESKAFSKVRKTGKVNKTAVTDESYVLYNVKVAKNKQGVWQTTNGLSSRGNSACTP